MQQRDYFLAWEVGNIWTYIGFRNLKSNPGISTKLRGVDSITFDVFGNGGPRKIEEETGSKIWKDVKTLGHSYNIPNFQRGKEIRVKHVWTSSQMRAT